MATTSNPTPKTPKTVEESKLRSGKTPLFDQRAAEFIRKYTEEGLAVNLAFPPTG